MDEFRIHWNANFAADKDYDLAHLWTGTDHDVHQGVAYLIHDGDTGQLVRTVSELTVPARGWRQVNRILAQYAPGARQGYVQVRQTSRNNPFIAYGIINDGAAPGQRSGDGAFLPSQQ